MGWITAKDLTPGFAQTDPAAIEMALLTSCPIKAVAAMRGARTY